MKIFYKTEATATGGRSGHTELNDGSLGFDLVTPQETGKQGVNPEQLFALGYAACFDSALNMTAQQMKLDISHSKTSVAVGIGMQSSGSYNLDLDISVEVSGISEADAQNLIEKAHQVCPYSNATRGNVDVRLHVTVV
ncbi:organic hydroperoxide resistance protein [Psychrobacter sanguinis]|uniref:Ohr family peroxiredoxin n=1 Tax=Psychrobacter sanguinis TaxID=861445 RepID=A0A844M363_9GAMM|nr:organic hydroperoxide resistance protein [Psychrobacter sanguinis]MUG33145.1 Ohr family peroxiredoxin [Psychrobacter sanguinis]